MPLEHRQYMEETINQYNRMLNKMTMYIPFYNKAINQTFHPIHQSGNLCQVGMYKEIYSETNKTQTPTDRHHDRDRQSLHVDK